MMVFDEMHYLDLDYLSFKQYSFQGEWNIIEWNILNISVYISGNILKYKYVEMYQIDIT